MVKYVSLKGIYPNLFTENEIWSISNEITPTITNTRRVERTQFIFNNFLNMIQERVHVIISLESSKFRFTTFNQEIFNSDSALLFIDLTDYKLSNLLIENSHLFTEFYVDVYKPFKKKRSIQYLDIILPYRLKKIKLEN